MLSAAKHLYASRDRPFAGLRVTARASSRLFADLTDVLTQVPFIVLYSPAVLSIMRKVTHNYQPNPYNGLFINIWQWWCDEGECYANLHI